MTVYDKNFFENQKSGSKKSSQVIIPFVIDLLHPQSVIDIGCGIGTWLATFEENNITDVLGIDGDYVDRKQLLVDASKFLPRNLTEEIEIVRQFDLLISLEVAEHLPHTKAERFITSLTRLAPVILFSAAIPGQGGTHHINEQWPGYWSKFFAQRDYVPIDCIRSRFWNDEEVQPWYAQNMILYVERGYKIYRKNLFEKIYTIPLSEHQEPLSLVHPRIYKKVHPKLMTIGEVRPKNTIISLKKTMRKFFNVF